MRTILLLLFSFLSTTLLAQNYILVKGKIIDSKSQKPVAFAHVGIPERGIGTTTAGNGSFLLKVPKQYSKSMLMVSYIGYKTFEKPIASINKYITIKLKRVPTQLQEVVVMDERRVENIIRKAVRAIPDNYPRYPTNMTGFYRESKTDKDQNYLYLAEGVLDIYKTSYKNKKDGQLKLIEGRKVDLVNPDSTRIATFTSGHWSSHRFDFVKNREDFIDERYFPVYKYWISGITEYNGRAVYIISFDKDESAKAVSIEERGSSGLNIFNLNFSKKKKKSSHGRMKGKLYIDTTSYAFLRAEFEIRKEGLKKYNDYPLYVGRWKGNKYIVNYRQVQGKWYFSESFREGHYRDGGIYSNEFVVTEINPKRGGTIPYLDRLENHIAFRKNTGSYDPDFWKDWNVTLLSGALEESVEQLQRSQLADEVFDPERMEAEQEKRDSIKRIELTELEAKGEYVERDEMGEIVLPSEMEEIQSFRRQARKFGAHFIIGGGMHFIQSEAANYGINYSLSETESFGVSENIDSRQFEIFMPFGVDLVFKDRWLIRYDQSLEYYNSIYRQRAFGAGVQFNLSKGRPFYIRGLLQHSKFQYARKIGQATHDFDDFKVSKKKFKSQNINLYYGARTHNIKGTIELAIEIHPDLEFFASASYLLPFATEKRVWLWERKRFLLSRKKVYVPLDELEVSVEKNDAPFTGDIANFNSPMFSIGFIFK